MRHSRPPGFANLSILYRCLVRVPVACLSGVRFYRSVGVSPAFLAFALDLNVAPVRPERLRERAFRDFRVPMVSIVKGGIRAPRAIEKLRWEKR